MKKDNGVIRENGDRLIPNHLAITMDGNGRWAQMRGLPRTAGHQAGVQAARRAVEACDELGVRVLTLYLVFAQTERGSIR